MIAFCPNCNQRYVVGFDTTDFIHSCNSGNPVIDEEVVVIVGNWEDFSGTGTRNAQAVMLAGTENEFQGTRAGIEGETKHALTARGKTATTHRQRQKLEFINIKNGKKN